VLLNSEGRVSYGTWHGIISYLTQVDKPPDTYKRSFYITFRSFATPKDLADALIDRARELPHTKSLTPQIQSSYERIRATILHNIFLAIKNWYENYWLPTDDDVVLNSLCSFLATEYLPKCQGSMVKECHKLLHEIEVKHDNINIRTLVSAASTKSAHTTSHRQGINVDTRRMDMTPADVACQLTIIESSCYCQIQPYELLNKEFSRGSDSRATNVRQMSRWCTQITRWASVMILSETTPERRSRLLKYFIELGIQLLALKNYDAVMAIKAAIYSAAVMRLKRSWSLLPNKYSIMCTRIHEAMNPGHNYANYRSMLRRSQPPLLPFLGLYLTDLTFLEDGNPTYRQTCALFARRKDVDLNSHSILINFEKCNRVVDIIDEMQKFQVEYSGNFTMAIPGLQQYLIEQWEICDAEGYDDDKIYSMSLQCEPR
ncbi:ras GEF, partial [Coemansia reversa NRRL 1564]